MTLAQKIACEPFPWVEPRTGYSGQSWTRSWDCEWTHSGSQPVSRTNAWPRSRSWGQARTSPHDAVPA